MIKRNNPTGLFDTKVGTIQFCDNDNTINCFKFNARVIEDGFKTNIKQHEIDECTWLQCPISLKLRILNMFNLADL